jgi:hypothetical protein
VLHEPRVERGFRQDPDLGTAESTGLSLGKALQWRKDGKMYSATGLVLNILENHGHKTTSVPGPQYWTVPDGRTLVEVADSLLQDNDRRTTETTRG